MSFIDTRFILALIIGIILSALFGSAIFGLGSLAVGYVIGLVARGTIRGGVAALIASPIGTVLFFLLIYSLVTYLGGQTSFIWKLVEGNAASLGGNLLIFAVLTSVGGLIGGFRSRNG